MGHSLSNDAPLICCSKTTCIFFGRMSAGVPDLGGPGCPFKLVWTLWEERRRSYFARAHQVHQLRISCCPCWSSCFQRGRVLLNLRCLQVLETCHYNILRSTQPADSCTAVYHESKPNSSKMQLEIDHPLFRVKSGRTAKHRMYQSIKQSELHLGMPRCSCLFVCTYVDRKYMVQT